ncbi:hypothetical protein TSAR_006528 [Trichomalopsis sarcophagae]|uniref:sulfite oxidase n=1 Tax=Trichomalopsis sarcophagae TaxID=543379 RepID=A0A232FEY2_9HYME|nr:hypothetical protein TSAR_006528 [Trichomalopsis sarcophagae]
MDTECKAVINLIINSKTLQEIVKQSCKVPKLKSTHVAEIMRNESNQLFNSKNHNSHVHETIWKYYSLSIAYAVPNSRAMVNAYVNRSTALSHIEEYEGSVKDMTIAAKMGNDPDSIIRLLIRKAWYYHCMDSEEKMLTLEVAKAAAMKHVKDEEDRKILNELMDGIKILMEAPRQPKETVIDGTLLNLKELYKKHVVNDFSAVKIQHDKKWGRHLVATRNIKPGEVIYVEEPYTKCLTIRQLRAYCSYCLTTTWSNVPCDHCTWTVFCSEECKKLAWKKYHNNECPVYACTKSDIDDTCKQLAIRCIALGITEAGSVENLKAQIKSFDECQDVTKGFLKNEKIQSMGFMSIYALSRNISIKSVHKHLENTAKVMRALVERTVWLKEKCDFNDCKKLKKNENAIFLAALFLRLSKIAHVNKHQMWNSSFCRNKQKRLDCWKNECCSRGVYLAPITALLNHSCDPNARRCYSLDHKVIVYATKSIEKGSQIFDCYQEEFYERTKAERCDMLSTTYNFDCDCEACTREWPNLIGLAEFYDLYAKYKPEEKLLSMKYKNIIPSTRNRNRVYTYDELCHVADGIYKTQIVLDQPSFLTTNLIIILNKIFDKMYGIKFLDMPRKCTMMLIRPRIQHKILLYHALRVFSAAACPQRENSPQTNSSGDKQARRKLSPYLASLAALGGAYYLYQLRKAQKNLPEFRHEHRRYDLPNYTIKEIHERRDQGYIWSTYGRGVYDLTQYAKIHPGGEEMIAMAAGGSLEPFFIEYGFHRTPKIFELLDATRVGNLVHSRMNGHHHHHHHHHHRHHEKPDRLPKVDPESYRLGLQLGAETVKALKLEDLKLYPKYSIVSSIPCKSDRKQKEEANPTTAGPTWTGTRLCDILADMEDSDLSEYDELEFECLDASKSGNGSYNTRVPLDKVLLTPNSEEESPELDVLLAYEKDGVELEPEHGYPVRVVMPQLAGSRNVKWLGKIVLKKSKLAPEVSVLLLISKP